MGILLDLKFRKGQSQLQALKGAAAGAPFTRGMIANDKSLRIGAGELL